MKEITTLAADLLGVIGFQLPYAGSRITDDGAGELLCRMRNGEQIYSKRYRGAGPGGKDRYEELGTEKALQTVSVLESRFFREQKEIMEADQRILRRFLKGYRPFDPDSVLSRLPRIYKAPLRRRAGSLLLSPAKEWAAATYRNIPRPVDSGFYRLPSGLCVRSYGEYLIAQALEARGIPFRYEARVDVDRGDGRWESRYPDFTLYSLMKKELYWEHLGMLDDPDYRRGFCRKLLFYLENDIRPGCNLILTAGPPGRHITAEEIETVIDCQLLPLLRT